MNNKFNPHYPSNNGSVVSFPNPYYDQIYYQDLVLKEKLHQLISEVRSSK